MWGEEGFDVQFSAFNCLGSGIIIIIIITAASLQKHHRHS